MVLVTRTGAKYSHYQHMGFSYSVLGVLGLERGIDSGGGGFDGGSTGYMLREGGRGTEAPGVSALGETAPSCTHDENTLCTVCGSISSKWLLNSPPNSSVIQNPFSFRPWSFFFQNRPLISIENISLQF